jgi:16S rRNA (uracil1498-N3)-methyltransferase
MIDQPSTSAHQFAIFWDTPLLNELQAGQELLVTDRDIVHRISAVLRLQLQDKILFFNQTVFCSGTVQHTVSLKQVTVHIQEICSIALLNPPIDWILPLLQREAFEQAIYILSAMGARSIQPIITQKIHRKWLEERHYERLQRIMVAACEQAKQFSLPALLPLISWSELEDVLASSGKKSTNIMFDAFGSSICDVISTLVHEKSSTIIAIIGPEGDLTTSEKAYLRERNFIFCALTPTILKAEHAITVAMGILRSCIR